MFANGSLGVHHIGGCCSARTSWFPCVLLCVVRDLKQDVKRLRAERDEAQGALDKLCREVQEGKPPRLLPGNLPPYAHLHRAVGPGPYPRAHRHMGQPPPPPQIGGRIRPTSPICWVSEFRRFVLPILWVSVILPIRSADLLGLLGL